MYVCACCSDRQATCTATLGEGCLEWGGWVGGKGGNASSKRLRPGVFKSRAAEGERPTWRHQSLGPNQPLARLTRGACSPSQTWRVANRNVNIGKAHFDDGVTGGAGIRRPIH